MPAATLTKKFISARKNSLRLALYIGIALAVLLFTETSVLQHKLMRLYESRRSDIQLDRTGKVIAVYPNASGYYNQQGAMPKRVRDLLLIKEDRYFYLHP